jgi:hypothetical protein
MCKVIEQMGQITDVQCSSVTSIIAGERTYRVSASDFSGMVDKM